jgi:hypothetical protein
VPGGNKKWLKEPMDEPCEVREITSSGEIVQVVYRVSARCAEVEKFLRFIFWERPYKECR